MYLCNFSLIRIHTYTFQCRPLSIPSKF
uniref:Uncharacterized protein n=1 Tax=Anguilla anguilla TaxID=7936 RepID=A0A0E9PUD0_ANGAN